MRPVPLVPLRGSERLSQASRAGALLCAFHCVITPIALALLPAAGLQWLENGVLELVLIVLPAGLLFPRLVVVWRSQRDPAPALLGTAGVLLLLAGGAFTNVVTETAAGVSGAALLILAGWQRGPLWGRVCPPNSTQRGD